MATPTAVFPAAIATDADLKVAKNLVFTTLKVSCSATDGILFVVDSQLFGANMLVSIDKEIIAIFARNTSTPQLFVAPGGRGFDGTTPAAHSAGAKVSILIDAWHHNALSTEIQAIEQALGPNLSNVNTGGSILVSTDFKFPPQTPTGNLTAGITNVVTIAPVPRGVNGTDTNHYLYISNGTGAPEAVLITGGTAVAGAPTGTLIFTPANNHSGAWTIESATAGIQEAIYSGPDVFRLFIPAGTHDLWGNVYLPGTKYASIVGAGMGITNLRPRQTTGNNIYLQGNPESILEFGDMRITRAGGTLSGTETVLYLNEWSPEAKIYNLEIDLCYDGIKMNAQPTMDHVFVGRFSHYGLQGIGARCGGTWNDVFVGNNIDSGAGSSAPAAVKMDTTIDGLYCSNCTFGGADAAFTVNAGTGYAANLFFTNCLFERYNLIGLIMQVDVAGSGAGLLLVENCRFVSRNTSTTSTAVLLVSVGGTIKIDAVTITNSYFGMNIYGIRLAGVSNATITGNTIFGTDLTGFPPQFGVQFDSTIGGTVNKGVTITGNEIGYGQSGSTARGNRDFIGGPLETPVAIDAGANANISITGNVLIGLSGNPVQMSGAPPAGLVISGNNGIDNVSSIAIASAATIAFNTPAAFNAYPFFSLTGNVPVTAVSGLWEGAKGMFLATHATPGAWTAGATIGNTFTPQQNVPVYWQFRGGKIWLK